MIDSWLSQFAKQDWEDAITLLMAIKHISADQFQYGLIDLINSRIESASIPVGLFVESERRRCNGRVHRLFKEPNRKHRRAVGSGPKIITPMNTVKPEVGSEGLIASIVTSIARTNNINVKIHPGPDLIRQCRIRRFILVTDFIGSGNRVSDYLNAAWRVKSVRSWWSARRHKGMSFEVIAYSATENGLQHLKLHPSTPKVFIVDGCPTIEQVFDDSEIRDRMRSLCTRYGSRIKNSQPLGYGNAEALIAFAHGMPNNAPAIFHKEGKEKNKHWYPLYPKRVTSSRMSVVQKFQAQHESTQKNLRKHYIQKVLESENFLSAPDVLKDAVHVLLFLDRPSQSESLISVRSGLSINRVQGALSCILKYGWADNNNYITDRGRGELLRLNRQHKEVIEFSSAKIYIPSSLRAPRAI